MPLAEGTIKDLLRRFRELSVKAHEMQREYQDMELEAAQIRALLAREGPELLEVCASDVAKEFAGQEGTIPSADSTLSTKIVAAIQKLNKTASPTEVANEVSNLMPFEVGADLDALRAKVSSELSRMVKRNNSPIKKVNRGEYALKKARGGD